MGDNKVGINVRNVRMGEIWYKPIVLDEGEHRIPEVVDGKHVARWYQVTVPTDEGMNLTITKPGTATAFAAENAKTETDGTPLASTESGLFYGIGNKDTADLDVLFKVSSMEPYGYAIVAIGSDLQVEGIMADAIDTDGAAYSISGQRVGNGYRGVVIRNGRKVIKK